MDVVALEWLCAVSMAREQFESGTDLIELEEALRELRRAAPDHDLLPALEVKLASLKSGTAFVEHAKVLRLRARRFDLD